MTEPTIHIAVIDDEESVVRALRRFLQSAGLNVAAFHNGQTFLASLDNHRYDCAVVDLHMPGIDGFEVQAQLAADHPDMPVIIMTGHDTPESHQRAMNGGASAYLRKPVDGHALLDAIEASIGRHHTGDDTGGDS
ncbi:MAG: response regulator [Phycisphaera sp.]|nr:response regulator [Phycisphaera sp.]